VVEKEVIFVGVHYAVGIGVTGSPEPGVGTGPPTPANETPKLYRMKWYAFELLFSFSRIRLTPSLNVLEKFMLESLPMHLFFI